MNPRSIAKVDNELNRDCDIELRLTLLICFTTEKLRSVEANFAGNANIKHNNLYVSDSSTVNEEATINFNIAFSFCDSDTPLSVDPNICLTFSSFSNFSLSNVVG